MSFANASLAERYEYNSFGDTKTISHQIECTSYCAWAVKNEYHNIYMCAIALKYAELTGYAVNARPLKDDDE